LSTNTQNIENIQIIIWSQLNHPLFFDMKQTEPWRKVQHPRVCYSHARM